MEPATLAGFVAAHAIWSVSPGELLIPILGRARPDSSVEMQRLTADDAGQAVKFGLEQLALPGQDDTASALAYDATITLGDRRVDAVILRFVDHTSDLAPTQIAVPYTPGTGDIEDDGAAAGFRVHRPKLLELDPRLHDEATRIVEEFFAGVDTHTQANELWNRRLDESL